MTSVFTKALFVCFFVLFICCNLALAQSEGKIQLFNSKISKSRTVRLTNDYDVLVTEKKKITILNKNGLEDGFIGIFYNELNSIEDFSGEIIDVVSGKRIDKVKLKDLKDRSYINDFSVFEDNRLKYYKPVSGKFPIEITYEYTTKTDGNMAFPSWTPEGSSRQLVEAAALDLIYPENLGLRYKTENIEKEPEISTVNGNVNVHWEFENLIRLMDGESEIDSLALVKIAPKDFSMEGYSSNMETWKGLGNWRLQLIEGMDQLSPEAVAEVKAITDSLKTDRQKIKALYRYMQDNYRYVSIQEGIGGWKPMAATEVFQVKYGDCKGLSIFMKAMLKAVGIPSNYTVVRAGSDEKDIDVDFPSNQFNHVILHVPMEKDTVWLECTSSTLPAGFLGDFTMNRHALVVSEDSCKLVMTPKYNSSDYNQIKNSTKIELLGQGMARIYQTKELTGLAAQDYLAVQNGLNTKDIQKYLYHDLGLSGARIEDFDLKVSERQGVPLAVLNHETFLQQFYQSTSKRMIITPAFQMINAGDLSNNYLRWEEGVEILSQDKAALERGEGNVMLSEDFFDYKKEIVFEDDKLNILRTVDFHFPDDTEKVAIEETLKQITKLDSQPIFLKK